MQSRVAVFLDDDAIAQPGWLAAVHRAFHQSDARVGGIGGRIEPVWEAPRPHWLADRPMLVLTMLDWSPAPKQIRDLATEWLAGANMAFRRDALEAVGGFHPALGRAGRRALSSEDVYLQRQLQRVGFELWYHPDMCVTHRVSASRLTQAWFRRRYFWQGVSDAVMERIEFAPSARERWSRARRRSLSLLRRGVALRDVVRKTDDPARFEQACWMWIDCGYVAGMLGVGRV
jgi:GT2 family glycosyltransferase